MEDSDKSQELALSGELPDDALELKEDSHQTEAELETAGDCQTAPLADAPDAAAENEGDDVEMNEENDEIMEDPENNNVEPNDTLGPPEELMEGEDTSAEPVEAVDGFAAAFAASAAGDSANNFLTQTDHLTVQSELPQQLMEEADVPEGTPEEASDTNVPHSVILAEAVTAAHDGIEDTHDGSDLGDAHFAVEGQSEAEEESALTGASGATEPEVDETSEAVQDDLLAVQSAGDPDKNADDEEEEAIANYDPVDKALTSIHSSSEQALALATSEGDFEPEGDGQEEKVASENEGIGEDDIQMKNLTPADQLTAEDLLETEPNKLGVVQKNTGEAKISEVKSEKPGGLEDSADDEMAGALVDIGEKAPTAVGEAVGGPGQDTVRLILQEGQLVGEVSAVGNIAPGSGVLDEPAADSNGVVANTDFAELASTLADGGERLSTAQRFDLDGARPLGDLAGLRLMADDDGTPDEAALASAAAAQLDIVKNEIKEEPPSAEAEADALATLASAALGQQAPTNGIKTEIKVEEALRTEPQWYDIGICKGTTCTVRSFLVPRSGQSWNEDWDGITTDSLPDHSMFHKIELESGKAYKFRVAALNSCGRGPWSEVSAFKTCLPGFPGAPSAIKITKSLEGAHLSWAPPSDVSGPIVEYSVYLAVRSATTNSAQGDIKVIPSSPTQLAFVRVYCGSNNQCSVSNHSLSSAHIDTSSKPAIIFRISARNEKGYGPATQVRWLQDVVMGNNTKPAGVPKHPSQDQRVHGTPLKRKKSE